MNRPKLVVLGTDQAEQHRSSRDGRKFKFEMGRKKVVFYASGFLLSLCFMFVLGVLVGRGVNLVSADDFSMKGEFLKFLGLGKQTERHSARAAETWADPGKMLESLNYYEDLTQKGGTSIAAVPKPVETKPIESRSIELRPIEPPPQAPVSEPAKEPAKEPVSKSAPAPLPSTEKSSPAQVEKPAKSGLAAEQYTLLLGSLKEPEAQALIEKLKAKGYSPRIEALDLGTVRWNRIMLGSFPSREAAINFAEEFNKKEKMEALVMRDTK